MPDDYPPDWPQIAYRIKRIAGWRCEHCGQKDDRLAGYMLTVHHLNGIKADCRWQNLVALCQRCHLHIQAVWHPGQPWLMLPPEWAARRGYVEVEGVARMDELTSVDLELLKAIERASKKNGAAKSLFHVAMRLAGVDYKHAHHRLYVLEALGYVSVERSGRGFPLIMRLSNQTTMPVTGR